MLNIDHLADHHEAQLAFVQDLTAKALDTVELASRHWRHLFDIGVGLSVELGDLVSRRLDEATHQASRAGEQTWLTLAQGAEPLVQAMRGSVEGQEIGRAHV